MKKVITILIFLTLSFSHIAKADKLDKIQRSGVLRVGTTGDYKPFSFFDGQKFSGYDIDVAKYLAKQLNVELELVRTSWKNLILDLKNDKFDIAMGGITRRFDRQLQAEQSKSYMTFGKCFLVAKGKKNYFDSLEKVNLATVKVGVNIGGTNEIFADANLNKANIIRFENNLDVPKAVALGKVDLMVTETPEALFYQVKDKRLEAVRCDDPFTKGQFGYLVAKGEQPLLNMVNYLMDDIRLQGLDKTFMKDNSLM